MSGPTPLPSTSVASITGGSGPPLNMASMNVNGPTVMDTVAALDVLALVAPLSRAEQLVILLVTHSYVGALVVVDHHLARVSFHARKRT